MNMLQSFADMLTHGVKKYKRFTLTKAHIIAMSISWVIVLSFFAIVYGIFGACVSCRERAALKGFSEVIRLYDQAKHNPDQATNWNSIAKMFEDQYQENKNAYIAPYFLLFKADALIQAGDTQNACVVMEQTTKEAQSQPLLPLIALKQYLLELDSLDQERQEQAIEKMRELGADISNIYADAALYHLGRYFLVKNRIDDARATLIDLFDRYESDQVSPSPWVSKAYLLLQQID